MKKTQRETLNQASETLAAWRGLKFTVSLVTFALKRGASRADEYWCPESPHIIKLSFVDGSRIEVSGRGRAHKAVVRA